jgi:hypothetical protein
VELINKVLVLDEPRPKTPEKEVPKPVEQNIQISETLPKVPSQRQYRPLAESNKLLSDNPAQSPPFTNEPSRP